MLIKKREQEINIALSESDCHSMWHARQSSTSSKRWREFGGEIVFAFLTTPYIKNKHLRTQQQCRRICGHVDTNHSHIFWSCAKIQTFWDGVIQTIEETVNKYIPEDPWIVYLGLIPGDAMDKRDICFFKAWYLQLKRLLQGTGLTVTSGGQDNVWTLLKNYMP